MCNGLSELSLIWYAYKKNKDINNLFCFQIAHFLEENFIEDYTDNVREIAGYLNTLAKIVRNDNQRNMGLHLFDESLA